MSSGAVSLMLALLMTPFDLVVFNQIQTRLYNSGSSQALKKITARQVAADLWRTKGLLSIGTMTFGSSLVRYFFVITSMYCIDNYHRGLAISGQ
jgi:hypothetical protein